MTPRERQKLKARAHSLKPVVMIGQHGLTAQVLSAIEEALTVHELIKIKIAADREDQKVMVDQICKELSANHIQSVGRISTIYRKNIEKIGENHS